jgi:predicted murein hydrolase (TIGR00659 family)
MINELAKNPMFGLMITVIVYVIMIEFLKRVRIPVINPFILTIIFLIAFLKFTGIHYDSYNVGGNFMTMMITPATVALAVPLYKNFPLLRKNWIPVIGGILGGVIANFIVTLVIAKIFNLNKVLIMSLLPKSVTTAIAIGVSDQMGGLSAVTVAIVVITGIFGSLIGTHIFKLVHIKNPVAKGLALGAASHAIGTSRAIEMGEVEGSMAGIAICVNGIATVALLPIMFNLFTAIAG